MSSIPGMSIDATVVRAARSAADQLGHVRYFAIAVLATLLLLIATSCSAPETRLVKVPVEKEVVKEVEVEKVVEVVKEVPVEKVVEVVKEVPVEKEVVKEVEVPVEVVVEKEVIKEVEVEKVVTKEVVKEVPVEKVVTKEVVKEVPVEKVVTKEVIREVVVTGDASTAPPGRQLAQHTHEGEIYTLVEYDHQIAVFSASGSPVSNSRLADDVLLSYAWGQTLAGLDIAGIAASVAAVEGMDDNIDDVRATANETVRTLDQLDALSAQVPLIGRVSAMDVIAEVYPGVAAAASAIRALDAELDSLGRNADALAAFVRRMERADPSDVSGGDMDAAFGSAVKAARDMEESVGSARGKVTDVRNVSGELANALRQVSDTPVIGETMAEYAETAARFESELSDIADTLQSYESGLANLAGQLQAPLDATASAHQSYVGRWLQRPYDTAWRDGVGSQPTVAAQPTPAPAGPAQQPFRLSWAASASGVSGGESFTLTVRMYGVRESGEHGGISVSFPSLTESGGSGRSYSSSLADVEAVEYTSGLSNVAFHQPGASIYRSDNSTQFPASHLLVESDDATWSTSDDRTLRLRITPKRGGEFPIRVRGWLCADGYANCSRSPAEAAVADQQGWGVEVAAIAVSGDASTPTPTPTHTPTSARQPISVMEITPLEYHQGERGSIEFRLRNTGSVQYQGVQVVWPSVRNSRDEAFYDEGNEHNDRLKRVSNSIALGPGDDGWVNVRLETYREQRIGEYTLSYSVRFYDEEGRQYFTDTFTTTITVVPKNADVTVMEVTPLEYHQGERGSLEFRLRNTGSVQYQGVQVIWPSVRNSRDEAFYDEGNEHNDRLKRVSNSIALGPGDDGWVNVRLETSKDQRIGEYTLSYSVRFYDEEGRQYFTDTFEATINVTG